MGTLKVASVALAVLAFGTIGAGVAQGHDFSAPSWVEVDEFSNDGTFGHVNSTRASCEGNRRVKLYAEYGSNDGFLGSDRTSDNGGWRIQFEGIFLVDQQFYAKVARRKSGRRSHDHVCRPDTSPLVGFNEGD